MTRQESREMNDRLANRWPDFIGVEKRIEGERDFLLNALGPPPSRILDAAMGVGCEAALLAGEGFSVTGNEIDPVLRQLGQARLKSLGLEVPILSLNWLDLHSQLPRHSFECLLILGNSFCFLHDAEDRLKAAKSFRAVCTSTGRVIVDRRNYEYILDNRSSILTRGFRYRANTMYCGTLVTARPIAIEESLVRFAYSDNATGEIIGHLDMYPLRDHEIRSAFAAAGFSRSTRYSDLQIGFDPDADFYTYIFQ